MTGRNITTMADLILRTAALLLTKAEAAGAKRLEYKSGWLTMGPVGRVVPLKPVAYGCLACITDRYATAPEAGSEPERVLHAINVDGDAFKVFCEMVCAILTPHPNAIGRVRI